MPGPNDKHGGRAPAPRQDLVDDLVDSAGEARDALSHPASVTDRHWDARTVRDENLFDDHETLLEVKKLRRASRTAPPKFASVEIENVTDRSIDAKRFGRYMLLDRVGAGGMADVFRAYVAEGPRRACVVKKIAPRLLENSEFRGMFLEEARISEMLVHPNIVGALDFGEIDGVPYIAFELIDGTTVKELIESQGMLPISVVIQVGMELARALEYAHGLRSAAGRPMDLIHRDISPENILVSWDGHIKLADFGIARYEGREFETKTNIVKGKVLYMAPEILEQRRVDARADLFSLGLVLVEMIDGLPLLPKAPIGVLAVDDLDEHVAKRLAAIRDLPADLGRLLTRLLAYDPLRRPKRAGAVKSEMLAMWGRLAERRTLGDWLQDTFGTRPNPSATEDLYPPLLGELPEEKTDLNLPSRATRDRADTEPPTGE